MPIGQTELLVILVIILLLFGSSKLPELARSMGRAKKEFKKGMDDQEAPEEAKASKPKKEAKPKEEAPEKEEEPVPAE